MKESCCQFGPRQKLAGILTEPASATERACVVLVSAGLTPKFGPFRLYTELARRLADHGFRSLRFDLGGIGDSGQEYDGRLLQERTQLQIGAALDHLDRHFDLDGVVLAGLCSGADDSFRYAEHDARVRRIVMVDPFAYRAGSFSWRHWSYRARRRLLRAVGLYRPLGGARAGDQALVDYENLPHHESSRILEALLKRKAQLHFVYTAGRRESFNHPGQLRAMFPGIDFANLVELDYLPRVDHTQFREADRRTLISAIIGRLTRSPQLEATRDQPASKALPEASRSMTSGA
jgi:pimeloyl-ACP methyl ester carboxylesterase